jgi:hypothetical protein
VEKETEDDSDGEEGYWDGQIWQAIIKLLLIWIGGFPDVNCIVIDAVIIYLHISNQS